ncbi:uncharacterized protein METZ01_LOCUS164826 [marine metagenome]|uniref:Uncharacterized protein n=1 Tax=marine metagenome TaxID=408172 RepID=A0A382BFD0_9ZZZZ
MRSAFIEDIFLIRCKDGSEGMKELTSF